MEPNGQEDRGGHSSKALPVAWSLLYFLGRTSCQVSSIKSWRVLNDRAGKTFHRSRPGVWRNALESNSPMVPDLVQDCETDQMLIQRCIVPGVHNVHSCASITRFGSQGAKLIAPRIHFSQISGEYQKLTAFLMPMFVWQILSVLHTMWLCSTVWREIQRLKRECCWQCPPAYMEMIFGSDFHRSFSSICPSVSTWQRSCAGETFLLRIKIAVAGCTIASQWKETVQWGISDCKAFVRLNF